ncbi:M56 family metallopeptidase [Hymenobacter swuensis]|uniref:Peptidase M56 domain-containing protein n=1 Tax=Hymenobacter swuensis DY53 TaxID=1227739 RepID=W8FAS7_9BACT|nr:M56 family metallopeptidase [Hymenobacter swuensis]AHJ98810.1 hypothetical protein Hsw_3215 [Hymenobacter swuensis DY53]
MNWLEQLLPSALVRALGWTLVHSLWQGAVVALALAGLLLLLRQHSAEVRYRTAAVGLLLLLTLSVITFGRYYTAAPSASTAATAGFRSENSAVGAAAGSTLAATEPVQVTPATEAALAPAAPTGMAAWVVYFDENIPVLVAAWLLGLLAMTLRLLGGLAYVQRLRRYRVQPLAEEWQARLLALADKAGLKQPIQLLESALVRTPVVVGHLRPVVLLPLGTVTGLSLTYLEAILAHELAHVQRRDYLMNLLQSVAETVFFYHPAVWFITACLRTERENCCDDVATALVGGNPLTVARALAALTELTAQPETANGRLALSALGPDGSVLGRIRRLVQGRTAPTFTEGFMAACVVLGGLVLLTSAVAIADPSPTAGRGALSRLPFLSEETDTTRKPAEAPVEAPAAPANIAEVTETPEALEPASASAAAGGDEEEKRRKRTRQQIVVVPQPGRNRPGTIVLEKDKKGRVTNFTVDGQRVEAATTGKKKSKSGDPQVEVVQLPGRRGPWNGSDNFSFNFDQTFDKAFDKNFNQNFRFQGPGLSKAEAARIRAEAQRAAAEARRQFSDNPQWRAEMGRNTFSADKSLSIRLQALQSAERSLRNTLQDEKLTEEQREEIQDRLSDIRDQQQDAREEAQDRQDEAEARRDEAEAQREQQEIKVDVDVDMDMRRHEEEMRRHDMSMRRHEEDMRRAERHRVADEALLRELRKDGLVKSTGNVQLTLTPTALTVNGKKQSAAVHAKYLKMVEQRDGRKLTKGSFVMNRQTNGTTTITDANMPTPPAPPAAPVAPRLPRAPRVPLPPAPPAAPRVDSDEVRAELRRDGLLGANEKAFQLQLTKDGLTVNGKKQSAALTEKYRKLLDAPDTNGRNTNQTIQISVSE